MKRSTNADTEWGEQRGGRGGIAYEGHIRAVTGGAMGVWQCVQATFAGLCVGRCINDGSSVPSQMLISAPFTRPTYADIFPVTMGERGRCSQHRIFFFLLSKVASELWQMWGDTVCKRNFRPQCQCSVQTAVWKHAYFRFVWKGTQWKQFAGFCDQMQRWIKVRLFFRCIHFCWNLRERGYILSRVTIPARMHTHARSCGCGQYPIWGVQFKSIKGPSVRALMRFYKLFHCVKGVIVGLTMSPSASGYADVANIHFAVFSVKVKGGKRPSYTDLCAVTAWKKRLVSISLTRSKPLWINTYCIYLSIIKDAV